MSSGAELFLYNNLTHNPLHSTVQVEFLPEVSYAMRVVKGFFVSRELPIFVVVK